ncbi:MAG: hypothetical protein H6667_02520 [Ardenticatenaceae bacterium]|nr:hypothetical protein [Ardenticatenaceae bacterium]
MTTTSERSAANTIYTQSVSIIASLLVGFGLIFLFARLGNRLQIRWPDGEIHDFGEIWLYGGVSIFVVLGWTITNQFDEGLEPFNTFKQALYIALGCWVFFGVILQGCVITLLAQNIIFPAIVVSFNLLVYIALGLSIGAIQALSVKLSGFNKQQHFNLLSNTTDLETCKNGELPYRQKVYIPSTGIE